MRVLVCGGRHYRRDKAVYAALNDLHEGGRGPIDLLIEGASEWRGPPRYLSEERGADFHAHRWAMICGVPNFRMPAPWEHSRRAAGPIRNAWMLKFGLPDLVVAFPGGTGTANMVKQAKEAGIEVIEIE